jgi:hypothetical protein
VRKFPDLVGALKVIIERHRRGSVDAVAYAAIGRDFEDRPRELVSQLASVIPFVRRLAIAVFLAIASNLRLALTSPRRSE